MQHVTLLTSCRSLLPFVCAPRVLQSWSSHDAVSRRCFGNCRVRCMSNAAQATEPVQQAQSLPSLIAAISTASTQTIDPGLHLVPTPIGNREDITLRALRVLSTVSTVYAEDTRHTRNLLSYYGISTLLVSLHEHNEHKRIQEVMQQLAGGATLALVSDAGMPSISDPGSQLVAAAVAAGHRVIPLPGPSAVVSALVASGLPTDDFRFVGFLPPKSSTRKTRLASLKAEAATLVCYVPPHSIAAVLRDAVDVLGAARRCCVARELTKVHEELHRDTLEGSAARFADQSVKGEITLVIEGNTQERSEEPTEEAMEAEVRQYLALGLSASDAAKAAASQLGVSKRLVYALSIKLAAERIP